jgi:hypothetical protein
MGLIEQAKQDFAAITSSLDGFGREMLLRAPDGQTALIVGLHSKHHLGINTEGARVNSKNAHISFSETVLLAANPTYPVRTGDKMEVNLRKHRVTVKDSTEVDKEYIISEMFPSETVGFIVCILSDYKNS